MARWTRQEIELLMQIFPKEGDSCYRQFNGKSKSDIHEKAKYLGLYSDSLVKYSCWQSYEDELLQKYYLTDLEFLESKLVGRTLKSIKRRAQELGLTKINRNLWTDDQIEYVKTHTLEESIVYTGKSRTSINNKLRELDLQWNTNIDIDGRDYLRYGMNLQRLYKDRSPFSIKSAVTGLIKNSPDVPEQYHKFINKWYPVYGNWVSLYVKDVTVFSILRYVKENLNRVRPWFRYEDDIIASYLLREGRGIVDRLHGRTYEQCIARSYYLGESAISSNRPWALFEDAILYEFYPSEGLDVEYRLSDRSRLGIHKRVIELGIKNK